MILCEGRFEKNTFVQYVVVLRCHCSANFLKRNSRRWIFCFAIQFLSARYIYRVLKIVLPHSSRVHAPSYIAFAGLALLFPVEFSNNSQPEGGSLRRTDFNQFFSLTSGICIRGASRRFGTWSHALIHCTAATFLCDDRFCRMPIGARLMATLVVRAVNRFITSGPIAYDIDRVVCTLDLLRLLHRSAVCFYYSYRR